MTSRKNHYYELRFEDGHVEHGFGPTLDVALFRLGHPAGDRSGLASWTIVGSPGGFKEDEHD